MKDFDALLMSNHGVVTYGATLEDAFNSNPALGDAVRALADPHGHRDYLTRLRFMVSK